MNVMVIVMYKIIEDENYNPFLIMGIPVGGRFTNISIEIQVNKDLEDSFLNYLHANWKEQGMQPISKDERAGFSKPMLLFDDRNKNFIIYFEFKDIRSVETSVREYFMSASFYNLTKKLINDYNIACS